MRCGMAMAICSSFGFSFHKRKRIQVITESGIYSLFMVCAFIKCDCDMFTAHIPRYDSSAIIISNKKNILLIQCSSAIAFVIVRWIFVFRGYINCMLLSIQICEIAI